MIKKLLFLIFILASSIHVFAQNGSVSGTITDQKGETVIGAAVSVVGTTIGVATDFDGKYSIKNLKSCYNCVNYLNMLKTYQIE